MASSKLTVDIDIEAVKGWLEKADMVLAVRCRDCVHYDKLYRTCAIWKHGVLSSGYCYRGDNGERRTE